MSLSKLKKKLELTNDVPMQDYTVKNRWIAEVKNKDLLKAVLPLLDIARKYYSEVEGKKRWSERAPVASFLADFFDFIEELLEEK